MFLLICGTTAANVGVVADDVVVIAAAVRVLGITTVQWCRWLYSAAVIVDQLWYRNTFPARTL